MTKGMRWLVGGLVSGVFLLAALPFALFGALALVTSDAIDESLDVGTVTGTVEEVMDSEYSDSGSGDSYTVLVRYTPEDEVGRPLDEEEGYADWAGDSAPDVGRQTPVHYYYSSVDDPLEAGSQTYTYEITGEGPKHVSWVLLGIAGGLFGVGVLGLILTAVIAAQAPASLSAPPAPPTQYWPPAPRM